MRRLFDWWADELVAWLSTPVGRCGLVAHTLAGWLLGCWLVWRFGR